jgi:plasmid maintenance system killer protein
MLLRPDMGHLKWRIMGRAWMGVGLRRRPAMAGKTDLRLTYIVCGTMLSGNDSKLSQQADEGICRRQARQGVRGLSPQEQRRLDILDAATGLPDLQVLPSNALESVKGDRKGQYNTQTLLARTATFFEFALK